jgi:hypothetical protein
MSKTAGEWVKEMLDTAAAQRVELTSKQIKAIERYAYAVASADTVSMSVVGKPLLTGAPVTVHHRSADRRSPSLHVTRGGGVCAYTKDFRCVRGPAAWSVVSERAA